MLCFSTCVQNILKDAWQCAGVLKATGHHLHHGANFICTIVQISISAMLYKILFFIKSKYCEVVLKNWYERETGERVMSRREKEEGEEREGGGRQRTSKKFIIH